MASERRLFGRRASVHGITPQSEKLKEQAPDEKRVILEIAFPQPARFLDQAIEPFKSAPLNPARGLPDFAADQIEGSADSDHDGDIEAGEGRRHEAFLLGRAEADPDDVGARGFHPGLQFREFGWRQWAEGRRVSANDLKSGKLRLKDIGQGFGRAGAATVEKVSPFRPLGSLADLEEKIGPVNALHLLKSRQSPDPDHGHSIRRVQERAVEDGAKGWIRLRLGDAMDAGDADVALGSAHNRTLEDSDGGVKVESMHADAEDVDAWREGGH